MDLYRPRMTQSKRPPTFTVMACNEHRTVGTSEIAGEWPLTIYVDKSEIVTLMTNGAHPELLTLGYLKNQRIVEQIEDIESVQVDWQAESAAVITKGARARIDRKLERRTVTTGCGQGTMYGNLVEELAAIRLTPRPLRQSTLYRLLQNISHLNELYRAAGAVHGCALCCEDQVLCFFEDVGRHNAVDAIAGKMWVDHITGEDKSFYTTGRLTSEMVIKVVQMGIPILISRSGVTKMGYDLAAQAGVTLIARAKGRHFLVYRGSEHVLFDEAS